MALHKLISLIFMLSLINCQTHHKIVAPSEQKIENLEQTEKSLQLSSSISNYARRKHLKIQTVKSDKNVNKTSKFTEKKCGESSFRRRNGRIIGDRQAEIGEFPWQVAMFQKGLQGFKYQCGGAILNEHWIITAAHCVEDVKADDIKIAVGTHNVSDIRKKDEFFVNKLIKHEKYHTGNRSELINDIALLHLSSSINLKSSDLVNSICLPEQGEHFDRNVEVSGWGQTHESGQESLVLLTVEVFVQSNDVCKARLHGVFREKEMLCAGVNNGGKDACKGDSGGPLIKRNKATNKATLVGLVSYGIGCARKGKPGVYTRVSSYVNWIQKHIQ